MVIANFLTPCGGGARWGVVFIPPIQPSPTSGERDEVVRVPFS